MLLTLAACTTPDDTPTPTPTPSAQSQAPTQSASPTPSPSVQPSPTPTPTPSAAAPPPAPKPELDAALLKAACGRRRRGGDGPDRAGRGRPARRMTQQVGARRHRRGLPRPAAPHARQWRRRRRQGLLERHRPDPRRQAWPLPRGRRTAPRGHRPYSSTGSATRRSTRRSGSARTTRPMPRPFGARGWELSSIVPLARRAGYCRWRVKGFNRRRRFSLPAPGRHGRSPTRP